MALVPLLDSATAPEAAAKLLADVHRQMGVTPNLTRAMANSPAMLRGYLGLSGALAGGVLSEADRERIALVIAQGNECSYCLSAHSFIAERVAKLSAEDITDARKSIGPDAKTTAILAFAHAVNESRGSVPAGAVEAARAAGISDAELVETIGHVALNVLTNYFNKAVEVDIDFPVVSV
jgi:uncharacterized peroxidase-related enzyme